MGVDRVVVGTGAALNSELASELFSTFGDRVVLSIASLNGYVAVRDWQARTDNGPRTLQSACATWAHNE